MKLDECIRTLLNNSDPILLGWEVAHRDDDRRLERKYIQLFIDELTFCVSGLAAILTYWLSKPVVSTAWILVSSIEIPLLILLGIQIARNADLKRGK